MSRRNDKLSLPSHLTRPSRRSSTNTPTGRGPAPKGNAASGVSTSSTCRNDDKSQNLCVGTRQNGACRGDGTGGGRVASGSGWVDGGTPTSMASQGLQVTRTVIRQGSRPIQTPPVAATTAGGLDQKLSSCHENEPGKGTRQKCASPSTPPLGRRDPTHLPKSSPEHQAKLSPEHQVKLRHEHHRRSFQDTGSHQQHLSEDSSSHQQNVWRQNQRRKNLRKQGSSSDLSRSRGTSPESLHGVSHKKVEKQDSTDQSRGSTPECGLQPRRPCLKKQSSSSDDTFSEKFDILWRLRSEDARKESPLVSLGQRQSRPELNLTLNRRNPKYLMACGRQSSLDSVLSPEKPQLSIKSMLSLCRGTGSNPKLQRQKEVSVEEPDLVEEKQGVVHKSWPSLVITNSSPDSNEPQTLSLEHTDALSPHRSTSRERLLVRSKSLDQEKDWELHLLKVLDANAASASNSPSNTPDDRRPSFLRRLKSLSQTRRRKSLTDDYGKGTVVD